jgi:hypothetical protein
MFFRGQQANPQIGVYSQQQIAIEPRGSDPGQPGSFMLYSYDNFTNDFTVHYRISGTASNGVDYTNLTGVATFHAGDSLLEIDVYPIEDSLVEGDETVILTLIQTNSFLIFPGSDSATNDILDSSTTVSIGWSSDGIEPDGPPGIPAQAASFTMSRSDPMGLDTNTLTVFYAISGTASNGVDYTNLTGSFTFLEGITSTNLDVNPLADSVIEGTETVTLSLIPTNTYSFDTNYGSATATIKDSTTTVVISFEQYAVEPNSAGSLSSQTGYFQLTRTDVRSPYPVYPDLTVFYAISGTASNGVDYTNLSGAVTFASGQTSTNIYVQPLADNFIEDEGDETVTFRLIQTNGFYVNTNPATILIIDNVSTNLFLPVVTNLVGPIGIDYHSPSNSLIVSASFITLARIYTNIVVGNTIVTNVIVTGRACMIYPTK